MTVVTVVRCVPLVSTRMLLTQPVPRVLDVSSHIIALLGCAPREPCDRVEPLPLVAAFCLLDDFSEPGVLFVNLF